MVCGRLNLFVCVVFFIFYFLNLNQFSHIFSHESICFNLSEFGCHRSYRSVPVAGHVDQWVRLPACGFLFVFYQYLQNAPFRVTGTGQRDGRITATLNSPLPYRSVIAFSPCLSRVDAAGVDVMLFHCIWRIYQIIL